MRSGYTWCPNEGTCGLRDGGKSGSNFAWIDVALSKTDGADKRMQRCTNIATPNFWNELDATFPLLLSRLGATSPSFLNGPNTLIAAGVPVDLTASRAIFRLYRSTASLEVTAKMSPSAETAMLRSGYSSSPADSFLL